MALRSWEAEGEREGVAGDVDEAEVLGSGTTGSNTTRGLPNRGRWGREGRRRR